MADNPTPRRDLYAEVTSAIIQSIEAGTPPWKRPWSSDAVGPSGPINGVTGRHYRGINTLLLGMAPLSFSSGDPRWLTFRQAQDHGWQIKKGSKSATVLFFKRIEADNTDGENADGERRSAPVVLRSYPVFHASMVEGIPDYVPPSMDETPWRKPDAAATILTASGVVMREGGDRAFYSPSTDHIQLPPSASFAGPEEWATTALHELGHATGHADRLNRDLRGRYGSQAYAMEELRAELASAFLAGELGIPADIPQHASYIDSWLSVLRKDRRAIFSAAADAQRIADWCLERHPAYKIAHEADLADAPADKPARYSLEGIDKCNKDAIKGEFPPNTFRWNRTDSVWEVRADDPSVIAVVSRYGTQSARDELAAAIDAEAARKQSIAATMPSPTGSPPAGAPPRPIVATAVAAYGPMPQHIARRLGVAPEPDKATSLPPPSPDAAPTAGMRI